jgi:mannose-6-phosphate isomerase-like protein (cupin superfamily)
MSTGEEVTYTPVVVHAGDGPVLEAFGDVIQVKLGGKHTGGALAVGFGTTPPGGGPPPHRHSNEDELFLVVEGRLDFLVAGEWVEVGPGGLVYIPRGAVHTFRNAGEEHSRQWVLTTPSGFERFFEACATVFAAGGTPDLTRITEICAEHGIEILAPPPGAGA